MKIHKAWLEVKGITINALARQNSVKINDGQITATFDSSEKAAELDAIATGCDFSVETNAKSIQILQAKPSKKRIAKLKFADGNAEFNIAKDDIGEAIAYYLHDETNTKPGEGTALDIVKDKDNVTEDDQIAINTLGQIFVSENVVRKIVKVRICVTIPRQVNVFSSPLNEPVFFHIVVEEKGEIKYCKYQGKALPRGVKLAKNGVRSIFLQEVEKITSEHLC